MDSMRLLTLEQQVTQLSEEEQLSLNQWLTDRLRKDGSADRDSRLLLMAEDPEIQTEIQKINEEFSSAEADGIGKS